MTADDFRDQTIWWLLAVAVAAPLATFCALGNYTAYISMIAMVAAFAVRPKQIFGTVLQLQPFPVAMLAGFGLIAIATLANVEDISDAARVVDFIPIVFAAILYCGLTSSDRALSGDALARLCLMGAALALAVALYEVKIFGMPRAAGLESNAIHFSNIAVLSGFLALAPFLNKSGAAWYFVLGPLLGLAAAIMGGSRSTLLVAAILLPFASGLLFWRWRHSRLAVTALAGALAAAIIAACVLLFVAGDRVVTVFAIATDIVQTGHTSDLSAAYRLEFYRSGWLAFWDSPIWGHGWNRMFSAAAPYMADFVSSYQGAAPAMHLHNDVVTFAVAGGVTAVAGYVAVLVAPFLAVFSGPPGVVRPSTYIATILVVGFVAMGLTEAMFIFEGAKVYYCVTAAAVAALARQEGRGSGPKAEPEAP